MPRSQKKLLLHCCALLCTAEPCLALLSPSSVNYVTCLHCCDLPRSRHGSARHGSAKNSSVNVTICLHCWNLPRSRHGSARQGSAVQSSAQQCKAISSVNEASCLLCQAKTSLVKETIISWQKKIRVNIVTLTNNVNFRKEKKYRVNKQHFFLV